MLGSGSLECPRRCFRRYPPYTESTKLLAVPFQLWQSWFPKSPDLVKWLEAHPQREDLYAALRPLLADRPRQDRNFLDEIDLLQPSLRTLQLRNREDLDVFEDADEDISWFLPSISHLVPDLEPYGLEGLSRSTLERAFDRSEHGLRLVGYPKQVLQNCLSHRCLLMLGLLTMLAPVSLIEVMVLVSWKNSPNGRT